MNFLLEFRLSQQWVHAKNSVRISIFIWVCWCSLLNFLQGFSVYITSSKVFHGCFTDQKRFVFYFIFRQVRLGSIRIRQAARKWETRMRLFWAEYWAPRFCWVLIDAARAAPFRNVLTQVAQPFLAIIRKIVETATLKNLHIS